MGTREFAIRVPPKRDADHAYRMGQDCARNSANTTNCHFSLFASPDLTAAWERGKRDAAREEARDGE